MPEPECLNDDFSRKLRRLEIDYEQRYFDLEKQLVAALAKFDSEKKQCDLFKSQNTVLEKKISDQSSELVSLKEELQAERSDKTLLQSTNELLNTEKITISEIINRKDKEIQHLSAEWDKLTNALQKSEEEICNLKADIELKDTDSISSEYQQKQLQQRLDIESEQCELLSKQISERNIEITKLKHTFELNSVDIRNELENFKSEHKELKANLEHNSKIIANYEEQIKSYMDKLKDSSALNLHLEQSHEAELSSARRLSALYEEKFSKADDHVSELTAAVEELQKLLRASANTVSDLEENREILVKEYEEQINEISQSRDKLQFELDRANELVAASTKRQELIELAPSTSMASEFLRKSGSGLSITSLYSDYFECTQKLQAVEAEKNQLSRYLDEVISEVETKAPLIRKEREQYEASIEKIATLTLKLDDSMLEHHKLHGDNEKLRRQCEASERQIDRLVKSNNDHSKQVQHLLREITIANGGRVLNQYEYEDECILNPELTSADDVINSKLVLFSSIEELQERNTQLLASLRALSNEAEEEQTAKFQNKLNQLETKYTDALSEIEHYKDNNSKLTSMIATLKKQKDMYKILLKNDESKLLETLDSSENKLNQSFDKELQTAKKAHSEWENSYHNLKESMASQEQKFNNELSVLQKSLSDLRIEKAKVEIELEHAHSKNKLLNSNVETCKKEIANLNAKNTKYSATVQQFEERLKHLYAEVSRLQENLQSESINAKNLAAQNENLRTKIKLLEHDKSRALKDLQSQNLVLSNLKSLQSMMERNEFEQNVRVKSQVESLEKELNAANGKCSKLEEAHTKALDCLKNSNSDLFTRLQESDANNKVLSSELSTLKAKYAELESELNSKVERLEASPARSRLISLVQPQHIISPEKAKEYQLEAQNLSEENKNLKAKIANLTTHIEKYKEMNMGLEQSIEEMQSASDHSLSTLNFTIRTLNEQCENREAEMDLLIKERTNIEAGITEATAALHQQLEEANTKLRNTLSELSEASDQIDILKKRNSVVLEEKTSIASTMDELQEKLNTQLAQSSNVLEQFTQVETEKRQLMDSINKLENQFDEKCESIRKQLADEHSQEKERIESRWNERYTELVKQNEILHEELSHLSKCTQPTASSLSGEEWTDSALSKRSADHLLSVVQYLRREKDIATTRSQAVVAEVSSLRARLAFSEKSLLNSQNELAHVKSLAEEAAKTVPSQHNLLIERDHHISVLQDSNRLLRLDIRSLEKKLEQDENLKNKLNEEAMKPLQNRIEELETAKETLEGDVEILKSQIEKWKVRNNELLVKVSQVDIEDFKKLKAEREEMDSTLSQRTIELKATQTRLIAVQKQLNEAEARNRVVVAESVASRDKFEKESLENQQRITSLQSEITSKTEENKRMREEFAVRNEALAKMSANQKKMQQIQQLARQYKNKSQELEQKLTDKEAALTEKNNELVELKQRVNALETAFEEAEKRKTTPQPSIELESQMRMKALQSENESLKHEKSETDTKLSNYQKFMNRLKDQMQRLKDRIRTLEEANATLQESNNDLSAKIDSLRRAKQQQESRASDGRSVDKDRAIAIERPSANIRPMTPRSQPQAAVKPTRVSNFATVEPFQSAVDSDALLPSSSSHSNLMPAVSSHSDLIATHIAVTSSQIVGEAAILTSTHTSPAESLMTATPHNIMSSQSEVTTLPTSSSVLSVAPCESVLPSSNQSPVDTLLPSSSSSHGSLLIGQEPGPADSGSALKRTRDDEENTATSAFGIKKARVQPNTSEEPQPTTSFEEIPSGQVESSSAFSLKDESSVVASSVRTATVMPQPSYSSVTTNECSTTQQDNEDVIVLSSSEDEGGVPSEDDENNSASTVNAPPHNDIICVTTAADCYSESQSPSLVIDSIETDLAEDFSNPDRTVPGTPILSGAIRSESSGHSVENPFMAAFIESDLGSAQSSEVPVCPEESTSSGVPLDEFANDESISSSAVSTYDENNDRIDDSTAQDLSSISTTSSADRQKARKSVVPRPRIQRRKKPSPS